MINFRVKIFPKHANERCHFNDSNDPGIDDDQ